MVIGIIVLERSIYEDGSKTVVVYVGTFYDTVFYDGLKPS